MPKIHEVKERECINSIAEEYGLFPDTVWEHDDNAELRELRGDPNVLQAGDKVVIPDKEIVWHPCDPTKTNVYRRKGVPAKFSLAFTDGDEPRANKDCIVFVNGKQIETKTDGDGAIEEWIKPGTKSVVVRFPVEKEESEGGSSAGSGSEGDETAGAKGTDTGGPKPSETGGVEGTDTGNAAAEDEYEDYELSLGELDPVTEEAGVRQRLVNLGYLGSESDPEEVDVSIITFKRLHCDLEMTAEDLLELKEDDYEKLIEVDDDMRKKLIEIHGS